MYVPGISRQKSIRTYVMFRPWTHTSDDRYIYQLSLVVATATVSLIIRRDWVLHSAPAEHSCISAVYQVYISIYVRWKIRSRFFLHDLRVRAQRTGRLQLVVLLLLCGSRGGKKKTDRQTDKSNHTECSHTHILHNIYTYTWYIYLCRVQVFCDWRRPWNEASSRPWQVVVADSGWC